MILEKTWKPWLKFFPKAQKPDTNEKEFHISSANI